MTSTSTYVPPKRRRGSASLDRKKAMAGWVFILPFVLGFLIIYAPLIIDSVQSSLSAHKGIDQNGYIREFVAFQNYQNAFLQDAKFTQTLVTGLTELLFDIPAIVIFSLFMAVLLNQKMMGRAIFRAIFFVPVILCTGLINTIDASMVTDMESGGGDMGAAEESAANQIVNITDISKLFENMAIGQELVIYVTNIVNNIYDIINRSGVQMLIFLAGLQSISPAIYESCSIDGASAWETFWKITFPMIGPMILVNTVYTVIDAFTSSANTVMKYIQMVDDKGVSSAMSWSYFLIVIFAIAGISALLSGFIFYQRRD